MLLFLSELFKQTNCVLEMTCMPTNIMDIWRLYHEFYGIPNAVTLGMFLGIIIGAIYVHNRSLPMLAVLGIYTLALTSATFLADSYVAPQFITVVYVIALGISSAVMIFVLKVVRE